MNDTLERDVRAVRMRFLDTIEPHRAHLHRFCRSLTPSVWEAEDLVQDTLLKAFAKLGELQAELERPRAFLFRVASNAWIDRVRKRRPDLVAEVEIPGAGDPAQLMPEVREALETLTRHLPPQERVALLLKDVFGFTLAEVARALDTTQGAVKSALHRGRTRLRAHQEGALPPSTRSARGPSPELLDEFVAAFNTRDLDGLTALLQLEAEAEVVGMVHELGRAQIRDGSLHHTLFDEEGQPRAEVVTLDGEPLVVIWYTRQVEGRSLEEVGDVLRFAAEGDAIRTLRYYYYCPELLREVAARLGLPVQTNGYRYRPKA